ncbi:NDR1/HIN1-like protein 6 isoform X1 [Eucalyptus grandis]|uniref:NDR1/HIN1-like protein 6 isoform X1 n=2 Tax=Eucalyptus grandis TaxID=71139 RepID=UPI00052471AD|nr:NDR1/HIN1-like protein 6 isoform X1 [Eucalyptus grandis]XP_010055055.1 NDR1/HIN1-like protein 6 isoform X1 [Eucalyptus grandis]XP_039168429.1 NDR1/HIN1-like protein 6 isoform X1 [Eucalyptus grandis]
MAEPPQKPMLQKPPGYRDPSVVVQQPPTQPYRKPVMPPSMYPRKKRRSCCRSCCCCLCVLIFLILCVLILAGALSYLWFGPKIPVFHLQSFRIPRFNVTAKPDGTYLKAQTVLRVEVKNPNQKLGLYYGGTDVDISLGRGGGIELGSDSLPGFTQGKKNVTSLKVTTEVRDELVEDGAGAELRSGYRSKSLVVKVKVRTSVGAIIQGWKVGRVRVNVECGEVAMKEVEGGEMPKCKINLLRWIFFQ